MSDAELRALEREVLQAPASLDLRRRHARALQRAGDEERALAALDLAWRLGADEVLDELRAGCAARRLVVRGVTLCYVPGGPFAMGADDQDDDAAPLHVVHLSPFYVAQEPVRWSSLVGWRDDIWPLNNHGSSRELYLNGMPGGLTHTAAAEAVAWLGAQAEAEGAPPGRWSLITEAQWERLARAALADPKGEGPYAVTIRGRLEWTADEYDPRAYGGARRDPQVAGAGGDLRVVRGVPVPFAVAATYREAARVDGTFEVKGRWRARAVAHERGIVLRPVLVPTPDA